MSVPAGPVNGPWSLTVVRMEINFGLLLDHVSCDSNMAVKRHPVGGAVTVFVALLKDPIAITVVQILHLAKGANLKKC